MVLSPKTLEENPGEASGGLSGSLAYGCITPVSSWGL